MNEIFFFFAEQFHKKRNGPLDFMWFLNTDMGLVIKINRELVEALISSCEVIIWN